VHYHFDISRFGPLRNLAMPTIERTLERADRIFVNSRSYAETSPVLQKWLDKCAFIPPGVDPRKFDLDAKTSERVQRLRSDSRFRVLFVGRLSHYKGLTDLVTAMQWVEGDLYLIGRGDMAPKLTALAEQLGLSERVHLLGRIDDFELVCQYHAADVVVLPSTLRGESFGVTQVEAMLCEKPVVCSDLPGVCEVGVAGETSCTFARGEAKALADVLNDLASDRAKREAMGKAGRQRALAEYDLEKVMGRRLQVYNELLGSSAGEETSDGTS
jgi:rhamnosyl/mannosyltransferase